MGQNTKLILNRIASKQIDAPHNWRELIAAKMNVQSATVDAYARGIRGLKKDKHIEVLTILNSLIVEHQKNIELLTA